MVDELMESVKGAVRERVSSPLIGGFLVSWCLWNWKFIMIVFSDNSVSMTLNLIDEYAFRNVNDLIFCGLLFPLVTALLYVFVYPYPAIFVYRFGLIVQKRYRRIRQEYEGSILLSVDESRSIYLKLQKLEADHRQVVDELRMKNDSLGDELAKLRAASADADISKGDVGDWGLTDSQIRILKVLDEYDGNVPYTKFSWEIDSGSKIQDDFDVEELVRKGLIERTPSPLDDKGAISFTHHGLGLWLKLKKTLVS